MNNVLLTQIEKIFESKAGYLHIASKDVLTVSPIYCEYHREGILWCISVLNQINQSNNPQDEIDLLFKTFNIKH